MGGFLKCLDRFIQTGFEIIPVPFFSQPLTHEEHCQLPVYVKGHPKHVDNDTDG